MQTFSGSQEGTLAPPNIYPLFLRIFADLAYICTRKDKTDTPHYEIYIKELGV